jgi:hypothetical protein
MTEDTTSCKPENIVDKDPITGKPLEGQCCNNTDRLTVARKPKGDPFTTIIVPPHGDIGPQTVTILVTEVVARMERSKNCQMELKGCTFNLTQAQLEKINSDYQNYTGLTSPIKWKHCGAQRG